MPVLNNAGAIYFGSSAVDAVYLGASKVWPSSSMPVYIGPQMSDRPGLASGRRPIVIKTTLPTDGEIVEIVADRSDSSQEFKILLYADNGGVPDDLIYVSEAMSGAFTSLPVSIPVTAGSYWLGVVSPVNNSSFNALAHEPGMEYALGDTSSWPSWPNPNPTEWVGGVNPPQSLLSIPCIGLWYVEAPPAGPPTFDGLFTPNMSVSPRLAEYGTASGIASCFTSTPLTGKHYIEMQAVRVAGLAGVALYNEVRASLPTNAPPGQWYAAAGFHSVLSGWSTGTYANTALPGAYSNTVSHGSSGSTQRHAICVDATDPSEVKIWVRTPTLPPPGTATWIGGGDPATGVDPTIIMEGEGPTMLGATLSAAGNSVEWIEPGDQQWTAPAGFVPT